MVVKQHITLQGVAALTNSLQNAAVAAGHSFPDSERRSARLRDLWQRTDAVTVHDVAAEQTATMV